MDSLACIKCFFKKRKKKKKKTKTLKKYFQNPCWQTVTLLERYSGVWPHQSKFLQYSLLLFHLFVLSIIMLTMINKLRNSLCFDIAMTIEGVIVAFLVFALMVKLSLAFTFRSRRLKIYEKIVKHFETITDREEAEVLKKFANRGFKFTAIYIGVTVIFVGLFDILPSLKMFYNYLIFDGELKLALPVPLDYGIDHMEYWYLILFHFLHFIYTGMLVDATFDLSFILQVHHVRALFKIVRMRLNEASTLVSQPNNEQNRRNDNEKDSYSLILTAVDLHKEGIEMAAMIEKTYSSGWCILMLLNSAVFGAGVHMLSLKLHDPIETLRIVCAFVILLMHLQIIFSQGQTIIDSSSSIHAACYECKWYNLPLKSRKLLTLMMTRSTVPCKLTGAQFFPMSMEMFTKMLKAGISYYTVFQK